MSGHFELLHIYNGIVFTDRGPCPMIEFKIIDTDKKIDCEKDCIYTTIFDRVNYRCGWFIVDAVESRLIGPVMLDLEQIKSGVRKIKDDQFGSSINGLIIECIDNKDIVPPDQIPAWMINSLIKNIHTICEPLHT